MSSPRRIPYNDAAVMMLALKSLRGVWLKLAVVSRSNGIRPVYRVDTHARARERAVRFCDIRIA